MVLGSKNVPLSSVFGVPSIPVWEHRILYNGTLAYAIPKDIIATDPMYRRAFEMDSPLSFPLLLVGLPAVVISLAAIPLLRDSITPHGIPRNTTIVITNNGASQGGMAEQATIQICRSLSGVDPGINWKKVRGEESLIVEELRPAKLPTAFDVFPISQPEKGGYNG